MAGFSSKNSRNKKASGQVRNDHAFASYIEDRFISVAYVISFDELPSFLLVVTFRSSTRASLM